MTRRTRLVAGGLGSPQHADLVAFPGATGDDATQKPARRAPSAGPLLHGIVAKRAGMPAGSWRWAFQPGTRRGRHCLRRNENPNIFAGPGSRLNIRFRASPGPGFSSSPGTSSITIRGTDCAGPPWSASPDPIRRARCKRTARPFARRASPAPKNHPRPSPIPKYWPSAACRLVHRPTRGGPKRDLEIPAKRPHLSYDRPVNMPESTPGGPRGRPQRGICPIPSATPNSYHLHVCARRWMVGAAGLGGRRDRGRRRAQAAIRPSLRGPCSLPTLQASIFPEPFRASSSRPMHNPRTRLRSWGRNSTPPDPASGNRQPSRRFAKRDLGRAHGPRSTSTATGVDGVALGQRLAGAARHLSG